tara:strand:+ start:424 stop:1575 length:1152 start_codon:yes stop_codon:yes gene_type:complete
MNIERLKLIVDRFFINTEVLNITMIDSGLVNKTYIVDHLYNGIKSKFVLQKLSNIFDSHEVVNFNHKLITDHITNKIKNKNFISKRWEVPSLIRCESNKLFALPFESELWRGIKYIDETFTVNSLKDERMAFQAGVGLAKFHLICSDLDSSKLETNIKDFHNTGHYIGKYIMTINDYCFSKLSDKVKYRVQFLVNSLSYHIRFVDFLLISLKKTSIEHNVIHGDPKLSNFLFDIKSKSVVSLIDLDTVYSGYLLTDLADCIRSVCNLGGEEPAFKEQARFDLNSCKVFLNGYFSISKINNDFRFILEFIYLIIFELTIRFLTDFLKSNRYFHANYETQNLFRAEVQYQLLTSFLSQAPNFLNELNGIGIPSNPNFVSDVQNFF